MILEYVLAIYNLSHDTQLTNNPTNCQSNCSALFKKKSDFFLDFSVCSTKNKLHWKRGKSKKIEFPILKIQCKITVHHLLLWIRVFNYYNILTIPMICQEHILWLHSISQYHNIDIILPYLPALNKLKLSYLLYFCHFLLSPNSLNFLEYFIVVIIFNQYKFESREKSQRLLP